MNIADSRLHIISRFLSEFATRAAALILFPLIAKHIGPEGYGVYAQVGAINGVLIPIATIGLGFSVVRLVSGKADVSYVSARFLSTLLLVVALSSVLALLVVSLAPLLNGLFVRGDQGVEVIRWSAWLIPLTAILLTVSDYYRARLRVLSCSVIQIVGAVVTVGGVALVLKLGGGLLEVVKVLIVVQIVQILPMIVYFVWVGETRLRTRLMPYVELVDIVRFGVPIVVMGVSAWGLTLSDRLVIGFYLDARDVGVYSAAYVLGSVQNALAAPFLYTVYPLMAAHKKDGEHENLMEVCRKYSRSYLLIGIPAFLGLVALSSEVLQALGTSRFVVHPFIFGAIAAGIFSDLVTANAHYIIYLHNQPEFLRNITIFSGLVKIGVSLVFVPFIGIMGAALGTLAAYVFLDVLVFRKVISYGFRPRELYDTNTIGKIAVSGLVMGILLYICKAGYDSVNMLNLSYLILLGTIVYSFVFVAVNRFDLRRVLALTGVMRSAEHK